MKKLFLLIAVVALPMMALAQNPLNQFFTQYAGEDGFTSVHVTADLFELMSSIEIEGDAEMEQMKEALKGLTGIQVLAYEANEGRYKGDALYAEAEKELDITAYRELVRVKDGMENVRIMAKDLGEGMVSQLLILVGSPDEFVYVSIDGVLDLNAVMQMGDGMGIEGLDKLQQLQKEQESNGTQAD